MNTGPLVKVETPVTFSCPSVPTEVSEELTTPEPSVVELNTWVPLISYCLPDTRFQVLSSTTLG